MVVSISILSLPRVPRRLLIRLTTAALCSRIVLLNGSQASNASTVFGTYINDYSNDNVINGDVYVDYLV